MAHANTSNRATDENDEAGDGVSRFDFAFELPYRLAAAAFGVREDAASVEVGDDLDVRFGHWRVRTAIDNVAGAEISSDYSVLKTIGPPHLSFSDRGLTFATNSKHGVCIRFREPVRGIDPLGLIRHPGLTVTVADTDGLLLALDEAAGLRQHVDQEVQAAEDRLHLMTASELRAFAKERGVKHASSASKAELVDLLEQELAGNLVAEVEVEEDAAT